LDEFTDTYHHMGTARMAVSADQGVVDKDCRVFGTSNLYICGAAVFPSTGFANPTLTAMALALRLSELVTALSRKA
jgi:choline dehydrogenase-like flavoprotein